MPVAFDGATPQIPRPRSLRGVGSRRVPATPRARSTTAAPTPRLPARLRLVRPVPPLLSQRDNGLIRRIYPWLAALTDHYYRAEVEGVEHLSDQASLLVSTHNGGMYTPDAYCLAVAFWRRFGLETPAYGLMHRVAFKVPLLGSFLTRLGAIHANHENAAVVLGENHPLLICPGGDLDALKPFSQRHRIVFGNRMGFVAVAIRHQVPIIPVISVGAHETVLFLNDGKWLARVTGFTRFLRLKSLPFALSFPLGVTPGGIFALPLPAKVRVRVLPPIHLAEPPAAADDPRVVRRCFDEVVRTMQASLDDLAARRRHVFFG